MSNILYFQDTELQQKFAQIVSSKQIDQEKLEISRDEFFDYLETDYIERVQKEFGDEQGLFGKVSARQDQHYVKNINEHEPIELNLEELDNQQA